ncbi:hypothetical protein QNH36_03170 [Mesobacillus sp. AQ2]|uniref:hypothetical protein n=1 Tax=Mesobacillus sp. AQ2 TaxID=3043332 RepID=UPI0024C1CE12|nr:hypothetical protein [Mesobacillus sp. AQ2]WHX41181.1 hypothetical protein QNH36_03170 [Mesobacillus sp. AQ2]
MFEKKRRAHCKKNVELSKAKREALNEKFLAHIKTSTRENEQVIKEENKEKHLIKEFRNQLRKVKKEIEAQNKLIADLKKENRIIKQKNGSLKKENWQLQEAINHFTKEYEFEKKELHNKLKNEFNRTKGMQKQLDILKKERSRKLKGVEKQIAFARQVELLKETNTDLKRKLDNYDSLVKQEQGDYKEEIVKLQKELNRYKVLENKLRNNPEALFKYLHQMINPTHLPYFLNLLEQYITQGNLKYFYREGQNVFYTFMRRVSLLGYHSKKMATSPFVIRNPKNSSEKDRLGYLTKEDGEWRFLDLTSTSETKELPVRNIANINADDSELPVRAIVFEGIAEITRVYSRHEFNPENSGQKNISKKVTKRKNFHPFGNFKVLIVGSRQMNDYKNRLEKHGCIVEIHNPYEEGFELFKGKISRAEIILVCERHVPHNMWDYIDRQQPFVSVLKNDSSDLIATYAYITLQRCELI